MWQKTLYFLFSLTNTINWKKWTKGNWQFNISHVYSSLLLSLSNLSRTRSILLIIFTALPHISMCAMWTSSGVRCHFMEHFFLGLSCFGSGGAGLASPGRSASASVPELSLSRHAAWLNYADLCSSVDLFVYHILSSTIVCDIAVLLVLVVAVSCLAFWRFWKQFL